jgi:signal transduction histidine kinase
MKKVALVFVAAVLVPSLVLAWLAVRSLRDQQFLLERQQSLLYQRVTDALAKNVSDQLATEQQKFSQLAEMLARKNPREAAIQFDNQIRQMWPLAEVGFSVTLSGIATCTLTCPTPTAGPEAQRFLTDNGGFLGNQESAEVYWNANLKGGNQATVINAKTDPQMNAAPQQVQVENSSVAQVLQSAQKISQTNQSSLNSQSAGLNFYAAKTKQRAVNPQGGNKQVVDNQSPEQLDNNLSKVVPAEAEFRQLIGDETDGMLARFLQNKLKLMFWHRLNNDPNLVFGAQLNLNRVIDGLRDLVQADPELRDEICVALLDDNAKPVTISRSGFQSNWKHPFVSTEVGEALPHWEIAAYLVNPASLTQAAHTAKLTLGLLIAVLVLAIGVGSWLIVRSLGVELKLARQKTDFVSNVSHELKTPLTSIRMFSELLAEGRVTEPAKQKSYLQIITAEAARLTRLINNVLDFSRMESGEKKYNFQPCDLAEVARNAAQTFRPHLEANGFKFDCALPDAAIPVHGDGDALSQIIVNLLSNAEKYSNGQKEISMQVNRKESPLPYVEIKVLDRGTGVPRDCAEKIFEKFYRAHDSLSSGIQGSGLGLTIARQIARAHGGDVVYESREGGGSCFSLRIPIRGETA